MLRKIAAVLVLAPLAIVIILFAVANREKVVVSFDPISSDPLLATPPVALGFVILLPLICGVVVGGIATWLGQARWRQVARRHDTELRRLRTEIEMLKHRHESEIETLKQRHEFRRETVPARSTSVTPVVYRRPPAA